MSEQNRKEKEAWSRRAQEAEAAGEPLKRHIRDLEAARDAHQQDIQSVRLIRYTCIQLQSLCLEFCLCLPILCIVVLLSVA